MFLIFFFFLFRFIPFIATVPGKRQQVITHYILCVVELGRANRDKLGR